MFLNNNKLAFDHVLRACLRLNLRLRGQNSSFLWHTASRSCPSQITFVAKRPILMWNYTEMQVKTVLTEYYVKGISRKWILCLNSGGSRGGTRGGPPPFIEKFFVYNRAPPLSQSLDDRAPPLSEGLDPPLLKTCLCFFSLLIPPSFWPGSL